MTVKRNFLVRENDQSANSILIEGAVTPANSSSYIASVKITSTGELYITGSLETKITDGINIASVTAEGRLASTMFDSDGNRIQIDGLGNLKIAENSLIVGESFEGTTIDSNFWNATGSNDGTVTQNGEILINTNTTANGQAGVDSIRKARKIPGTVGKFRSVGHFASIPDADNVRTIGISDFGTRGSDENGAWFKLDGTTFKIVTSMSGTETEVSSGNFNGDVTSWTPDTNIHRFVIEYTAYIAKFIIDGVLIHKVISESEPWTRSLTLGIRVTNINSGGNTTNNKMYFQVLCIIRIGKIRSAKSKHFQTGVVTNTLKSGGGAVVGLIIAGVVNNSIVTLYDSTAATVGTEFFSTGAMNAKVEPTTFDLFGIDFFDGLTLAVTDASANVTVVYE